jgi:hypothetical protein
MKDEPIVKVKMQLEVIDVDSLCTEIKTEGLYGGWTLRKRSKKRNLPVFIGLYG